MAHRKGEWEQLNEKLAQCEYERDDARRTRDNYALKIRSMEIEIATAVGRLRALKDALAAL